MTNSSFISFRDDPYYFHMAIASIILSSICIIICCSQCIIFIFTLCSSYLLNYINKFNNSFLTLNPISSIVITNIIDITNNQV